jgi:antirestriction protein ArdC
MRNAQHSKRSPELEEIRDSGWDPIEQAEKLLKASQAKIVYAMSGGAFYCLFPDTIQFARESCAPLA